MSTADTPSPGYTLAELCSLAGMGLRTVRYYIQAGLVDRPQGETRAARYDTHHLEQLLLIRKWTAAGVSLERIRSMLAGGDAPMPHVPLQPGTVTVNSHLHIAEGLELVIDPGRAGLSPEQVRALVKAVMAAYRQTIKS